MRSRNGEHRDGARSIPDLCLRGRRGPRAEERRDGALPCGRGAALPHGGLRGRRNGLKEGRERERARARRERKKESCSEKKKKKMSRVEAEQSRKMSFTFVFLFRT